MHYTRLIIIAAATILALALGVSALVAKSPAKPNKQDSGGVIIIKGGSLTIQCYGNTDCLGIPSANGDGQYGHKDNGNPQDNKKIRQIKVIDSSGKTLFDSSKPAQALGKTPSIEITYK